MEITTLSSRELNRHPSAGRKAAKKGPVFITHRGWRAHVLLSIEDYQRLAATTAKISDLLFVPGADEIDVEINRAGDVAVPADLV